MVYQLHKRNRMIISIVMGVFLIIAVHNAESSTVDPITFREDSAGIDIVFTLPELEKDTKQGKDGFIYDTLEIPGGGYIDNIGKPFVPVYRAYFQIRDEAEGVSVTAIQVGDISTEEDILIYPAQDSYIESEIPWVKDEEFYQSDIQYPSAPAQISEPFIIRKNKIVLITFCPVQFNPTQRKIEVANHIWLRLDFIGITKTSSKDQQEKARYKSPNIMDRLGRTIFDNLLGSFVRNYAIEEPSSQENTSKSQGEPKDDELTGADYLIIMANNINYYDELEPLVELKEEKGLMVKIASLREIGESPTAEDITDYIRTAYETWNPAPTYLLLVGDVQYLPVHYGTINGDIETPTDLYYSTVDGDDYFPDIFVGRLPVGGGGIVELRSIVSKIVQRESMEQNNEFFSNVLMMAQDAPEFHDNMIERVGLISSFLESDGFSMTKVYADGEYTGTTEDVLESIDRGVFMMMYNGHGSVVACSEPEFGVGQIPELNNINQYPIMFTLACYTGYFADEEGHDCLGEAFILAEDKGGAGFIGSSLPSSMLHNNALADGFIDAFRTNFRSYRSDYSGTTKIGEILLYGKMYVYSMYGGSIDTQTHFELYNLLGEPEMDIYPTVNAPYTSEIISPYGGKFSDEIDIIGTATGDSFALEIGYGSPVTRWELLTSGTGQIVDETILTLSTADYPDDKYILRLTAFGDQGDVVDRTVITISNVLVHSPQQKEVVDVNCGMNIEVEVLPSIDFYEFSYSSINEPENWQRDGFDLSLEDNNIIGKFDTSHLELGRYYLKIAVGYHNVVSEHIIELIVESYQDGWPQYFPGMDEISPPVTYDVDLDGKEEIIILTSSGKLYVFNDDGTFVSDNWPIDLGAHTSNIPAIGDIDNNGSIEIITEADNTIYIFNTDGTPYKHCSGGWNININQRSSPIAADTDNDGFLELIVGGENEIRVINYKGEMLNGWPIPIEGDCFGVPAVGDVDNDGCLDIIVGSDACELHVLNRYGDYLWGGPKQLPREGTATSYGTPIIGDIDGDGNVEICITPQTYGGNLIVLENDGTILIEKTYYAHFSRLALCDFNSDGLLEILTGAYDHGWAYMINLFDIYGNKVREYYLHRWRYQHGSPFHIIADVNKSGTPDVVVGHLKGLYDPGGLYAFDLDSTDEDTPIEGYPKYLKKRLDPSTVCISDLDKDRDLEVIVVDNSGIVYVFDLQDRYDKQLMQWPMFQHDARHTGNYHTPTLEPIQGRKGTVYLWPLRFTVEAYSPDMSNLTLTACNLPEGATFHQIINRPGIARGVFLWNPRREQIGTYTVQFIVTNNRYPAMKDYQTVPISVYDLAIKDRVVNKIEFIADRIGALREEIGDVGEPDIKQSWISSHGQIGNTDDFLICNKQVGDNIISDIDHQVVGFDERVIYHGTDRSEIPRIDIGRDRHSLRDIIDDRFIELGGFPNQRVIQTDSEELDPTSGIDSSKGVDIRGDFKHIYEIGIDPKRPKTPEFTDPVDLRREPRDIDSHVSDQMRNVVAVDINHRPEGDPDHSTHDPRVNNLGNIRFNTPLIPKTDMMKKKERGSTKR